MNEVAQWSIISTMNQASYREVRKYSNVEIDANLVSRAADLLCLKSIDVCEEQLQLGIGLNLWSFGERITVGLGSVDGARIVDVSSRCVLKTQIADWGKNQRNVRKLFNAIDGILGDNVEYVVCPVCANCGYLLLIPGYFICPECGEKYLPNKVTEQDSANFRNVLNHILLITTLEIALVSLLKAIGVGGIITVMFGGFWGALRIVLINSSILFAVCAMHRIVKKRLKNR